MITNILIVGFGRIGTALHQMIKDNFNVAVFDTKFGQNIYSSEFQRVLQYQDLVVSLLPPEHNYYVAKAVINSGNAHYLDATEDIETTQQVFELAKSVTRKMVIPNCGLAPGFINILGKHLLAKYDEPYRLDLRVGALPQYPVPPLNYNFTWSVEGVVNEYLKTCYEIFDHEEREADPLCDVEDLCVDGVMYEVFNTSGGIGSQFLHTILLNYPTVRYCDYKSIRYPGHAKLMSALLYELGIDPEAVIEAFKQLPITRQDKVIVHAYLEAEHDGKMIQDVWQKTFYPKDGLTAIERTTASSIATVIDLIDSIRLSKVGFVKQEDIDLDRFLK